MRLAIAERVRVKNCWSCIFRLSNYCTLPTVKPVLLENDIKKTVHHFCELTVREVTVGYNTYYIT